MTPYRARPFVLLPVGRQADDAQVPDLPKKDLDEVTTWLTSDIEMSVRHTRS